MTRLVLASQSPTRAAVLANAGLDFAVAPAGIDERALDAAWTREGRSAAEIAGLLAAEKALAVAAGMPDALVIGADQTLALGGERFSKPASLDAARAQLLSFRGRIHHLHAGVALARGGALLFGHVATAAMAVRSFSQGFLDGYLEAMGERVLQSVGCYQVEGRGIQLFERIEGDHFTVLGLPLLPLLAALRDRGVLPA